MITAPESYGQLIAVRYAQCIDPLLYNPIENAHLVDNESNIVKNNFVFIANRVSQAHELCNGFLDIHGRLDEKKIPHGAYALVDEYLSKIEDPCPERKFSVLITHDVDRTTLFECTAIAKLIKKIRPKNLISTVRSISAYWTVIERTIDKLLCFEADNNIRAVYFLLSGPYSLARYGSRTNIEWTSAKRIINSVKVAGMEIGLHGSYYAMAKNSYTVECQRLADETQAQIRHHRNHYLRYDPLRFWQQLSTAGIEFDHSVGLTHGWGFRTGTSIPYPVFDFSIHSISKIIEVPLLLMDGAWIQKFEPLVIDNIRTLLETVRKHRGCVSINFHPEAFVFNEAAWEYFRNIISICRELGAEMTT